jgi:hypothetical protein
LERPLDDNASNAAEENSVTVGCRFEREENRLHSPTNVSMQLKNKQQSTHKKSATQTAHNTTHKK